MRVDGDAGARQARTVDQRSVVQRLRKDHGVRVAAQRRQHRQVGHVARAEVQGTRIDQVRCLESGQSLFQQRVRAAVARHQVGSAAAGAVQFRALAQGRYHARVGSQSQVIVAAEGEHGAAVDHLARRGRRVGGTAAARQALCRQRIQLPVDARDQIDRMIRIVHHASAITFSNTVRVRAASPTSSSSLRM
jgi:hypothetical protein